MKKIKIIKSFALGLLGSVLIVPSSVLANGDRLLNQSHSNTDWGYGLELDSQQTVREDSTTGKNYLDSQTHIQKSTDENTFIYGGSNSRDYVNTNERDRSTYEFGIKYEY